MARPRKQTVDYFPHMCTHGKTMFVLEQRYGNDGYTFWFKLLESLGETDGHYLELDAPAEMEFLAAKTRLSVATCREILDLLTVLGAIDAELWHEHSVVWSDKFVVNVADAYRNRKENAPLKPCILREKPSAPGVYDDEPRQKSTNEIKLNETKGDNNTSQLPAGSSDQFDADHPAMQLAEHLRDCILDRDPNTKAPKSMQAWAIEADRLLRIDNRPFEEAWQLATWCQCDSFWSTNILSMAKFRKQYDLLKRKAQQARAPTQTYAGTLGMSNDRMRAYEEVMQRG